jgi:ATP-dependent protease ClpP protease subunit
MKTKFFNIIPGPDTVAILLYGDVGERMEVDSARVVNELLALQEQYKHIDVRINSRGGDVFCGMAIYNALCQSTSDITIYIDGVAASIAGIIALCGKPLYMSPYSKLMLHNVSGGTYGSSEDLRQIATQMDKLQSDLATMISGRCGLKPQDVVDKYFDGTDHWIDADEAVKMKLADGIYTLTPTADEPAPETTEEVYNYFNNRLINWPKNQTNDDMALLDDIKKIPSFSNAGDGNAVVAQIRQMENEHVKIDALQQANESYKNQIAELQKEKVTDFLNQAVAAGKITQEQVPTMTALMNSDRKNTEALINSMTAKQSARAATVFSPEDKAGFEGKTWDELDKENRLAELKNKDMAMFKMKYRAYFGVDYKE